MKNFATITGVCFKQHNQESNRAERTIDPAIPFTLAAGFTKM
jgi:hypothetical protein